jgi:integrase
MPHSIKEKSSLSTTFDLHNESQKLLLRSIGSSSNHSICVGKVGKHKQREIVMKTIFTDTFIKNIKQSGRYTDAATTGLNFNVKNNKGGYWVYRFSRNGNRHDLALGAYPSISLREARKRAITSRSEVLQGKLPTQYWRLKEDFEVSNSPQFSDYAKTCIESKRAEWKNSKHASQWVNTIQQYANPYIGKKHLDEIDTQDILNILNPIWHKKTETASRLRGRLEWILASATTRKMRSGINPAAWKGHLETILPKPSKVSPVKHHPALPYRDIPKFMKALREKNCLSALALEFLILNANRSGEVLNGLRHEINEANIWVIPAHKMKANREHRVPLGIRSIEILVMTKEMDPNSNYMFSKNGKSLTNMAMAMLLRGINPDITIHGFRSTFRDWVAEETFHSSEAAEKALAHTVSNQVEAAYRRGDLLEHRKKIMKDWEDYCIKGTWGDK